MGKGPQEGGAGTRGRRGHSRKRSRGIRLSSTDEGMRKKVIALKKSDKYQKANFTRFRELLEERERIKISYVPFF
jgi:hypothetical protein